MIIQHNISYYIYAFAFEVYSICIRVITPFSANSRLQDHLFLPVRCRIRWGRPFCTLLVDDPADHLPNDCRAGSVRDKSLGGTRPNDEGCGFHAHVDGRPEDN